MDILYLDAADQLQLLSSRQISARELLDMSVARAESLNASLNAVVSRDLERAFADA